MTGIHSTPGPLASAVFRALLAMLLSTAAHVPAHAQDRPDKAAGPAWFASADNEGFRTRRVGADLFPAYRDAGNSVGLRYREQAFDQDAWSRSGRQIALSGKGPLRDQAS